MSDIELGSVISLIMENPELIAEIKRLAESRDGETDKAPKNTEAEEPIKTAEVIAPPIEAVKPNSDRQKKTRGKRSEFLHALSPYISEGRQKALETFMTIADILDMMREK